MNIEVTKSKANGGEYVLRIDGRLRTIRATIEATADDIRAALSAAFAPDEDE